MFLYTDPALCFLIRQPINDFLFQALRVPPLLLEPRAAHLPGHEEAHQVGPVRVPQPGVEERLQRCQRAHQGKENPPNYRFSNDDIWSRCQF